MKKDLIDMDIKWKEVVFDLPFLIFVKDGFKDKTLEDWAEAYSNGSLELPHSPYAPDKNQPSGFILGGGFPVYLPPNELAPPYQVLVEEDKVLHIQFLRRINQKNPNKIFAEVIGDRTGRTSFSTVRVYIESDDIEDLTDMSYIVELALKGVNKFLSHYKVVAGRFYIYQLTPSIIQSFHIITKYEDDTSFYQIYGSGSGPANMLGGAIENRDDEILRQNLVSSEEPDLVQTLELQILDKLDIREWRLAVIESAVLFETWLSIFLRNCYDLLGLKNDEIDQKFLDSRGFPKSAYSLAKNSITDATGFEFHKTSEFREWSDHTKDLRNDLVHGKRYSVSKEEAEKSYKSVINAILLIINETQLSSL